MQKKFNKPAAAFLAGELLFPGTESCFLIAGGVELSLLKGLTGWTGVDRDPIERGKVWLFERGAFGGLFAGTVNFFPDANKTRIIRKMLIKPLI